MRKNLRRFGRVVVIGAAILWSAGAQAAERVALVIGNGDYGMKASFLVNPRKDAVDVAEALKRIGFDEVVVLTDQSVNQMTDALRAFKILADSAEIAVIYYAGHGREAGGVNYLVPVGAGLTDVRDAPLNLVTLDLLRSSVSGAGSLSLIILDACRDNPFPQLASSTRSLSPTRGLGPLPAAPGSRNEVVAYAAADGQRAQDGPANGNSPYAKELIEALEATPRLPLSSLLGRVRDRVWNSTDGLQTPYHYGSTGEREVYLQALLLPPPGQPQPGPTSPPAPPPVWTPPQGSPGASAGAGVGTQTTGPAPVWTPAQATPAPFALSPELVTALRRQGIDPSQVVGISTSTSATLANSLQTGGAIPPGARVVSVEGARIPQAMRISPEGHALGADGLPLHMAGAPMFGLIVPQSLSPAEVVELGALLRRATQGGEALAMSLLADRYLFGRGVAQNDVDAVRWLRRAADLGDARAMSDLGVMYAPMGTAWRRTRLKRRGSIGRRRIWETPEPCTISVRCIEMDAA